MARSVLPNRSDLLKLISCFGVSALRRMCSSNNERYTAMQTRLFKLGANWPRTAAVTATALCFLLPAFPTFSSAVHNMLITENSDTSLTVSWDGSAITPTLVGNDHWTITVPVLIHLGSGEGSFGAPDGAAIAEPGAGSLGPWNNVFTSTTLSVPYVDLVDVTSDSATTSAFATVISDNSPSSVGTDSNGEGINLTFHDVGDGTVPSAPDNGSTIALLLISLTALFGAGRWFRAVQAS